MRRKYELGAKARLSFSGGPHAPVNMADSMENAGSWTVSGSKEAMEVPKNFKDLRKLGVRKHEKVVYVLKVEKYGEKSHGLSGAWHNHFRRVAQSLPVLECNFFS